MGAAPSIITLPSTSIAKDIEALKAICPSRFRVDKATNDSETIIISQNDTNAVLTTTDGSLTVVLVAIPVAAANRVISNRITFVLQEQEMKNVVNRCEDMRLLTKTITTPRPPSHQAQVLSLDQDTSIVSMAELNLPGGAAVALVSPSMVVGSAARLELGKKLAESLARSLPKGITRANSINNKVSTTNSTRKQKQEQPHISTTTTPRSTPEHRQSLGVGRSVSSPRTPTINNIGMSLRSPRQSPHHQRSLSPSKLSNQQRHFAKLVGSNNLGDAMDVPLFPTLKISSLHLNGKYKQDFHANSRVPIPIETELFVGHMVFLIRPTGPLGQVGSKPSAAGDSHWSARAFANKNRRIMVQLQGKFKYEPKGVVYAGLEASTELRLGRLSRG
jgi:Protein of unknown function (DUF1769)